MISNADKYYIMREFLNILDQLNEATIADYPAGTVFLISGSKNGQALVAGLTPQGINVEDTQASVAAEEVDPEQVTATYGRPGSNWQAFRDAEGQVWIFYGGASVINSSFVHADKLANKGEIAEGILGAAMFAKFTKRVGKEEIAMVTPQDVADVLDQLKNVGEDTYQVVVNDADNQHADTVTFRLVLKTKPYQDLMDPGKREALKSEFASAAGYVNTPMAERYSRYFYLNGRADEIAVIADGAASETSSKVDVWVAVKDAQGNMRRLRLNTSLKVGGIKQFGQVGGSETASMNKLWNYFGVDIEPFLKNYEKKRKTDQFDALEYMYKSIAESIAKQLEGDDDQEEAKFVDNVAHAVTYFATLGDKNVELVDFSKGGFKILRFSNLVDKLRSVDLTASYKEAKGRPEIAIHDKNNPKRELISVRVKIENRPDSIYVRNIIEKGSLLEEITQVQQRAWDEVTKKVDAKIDDLSTGRSQSNLKPIGAPRKPRTTQSDGPRQRR
jgi:hypothetical protein